MKHITFSIVHNEKSGVVGLVPQNQDDANFLINRFEKNIIFVIPEDEQNSELHSKYFAIISNVIDQVDVSLINNYTGLELKNGDKSNLDVFRRFIMVKTNFLTPAKATIFGQEVLMQFPKSVAYPNMKAPEFNDLYKATIEWLNDFLKEIGWNEQQVHKILN